MVLNGRKLESLLSGLAERRVGERRERARELLHGKPLFSEIF